MTSITIREDLPICVACGSQYDSPSGEAPNNCKICDDPRQFVPPTGQQWTTLATMKSSQDPQYHNTFTRDSVDTRIWSIATEPKFGIGQRAMLLQTESGNVLWDLIALLDEETAEFIKYKGGLVAIVISHPHYYTTYATWARTFNCPVYIASDDAHWLCQNPYQPEDMKLLNETETKIVPGVTAIKIGGHFEGQIVLHWEKTIFVADGLVTVPSAHTPHPRPPGQITYSFMWSIPNMIPLPVCAVDTIWRRLKPFDFDTSHGAFASMTVRDEELKERLRMSAEVVIRKLMREMQWAARGGEDGEWEGL